MTERTLKNHRAFAVALSILVVDALVILPSVAVAYITTPWGNDGIALDPWPHDLSSALMDGMIILNPVLVFLNAILMCKALWRGRWLGIVGWLTFAGGTAFAALFITPLALIALL